MENGRNVVFVDGKAFGAMCRCGASANKPYYDGAHAKAGFTASRVELQLIPLRERGNERS